ncbi:MAG: PP2C family protein-serine/threonine phosphatase [Alphaproteobacteria bacterium]|nr:PP2C family protein-serine/threonine phosphatase [Alphaproteobacteria bacterium]
MADSIKILVLDDEEDTKDLFQQEFRHQIERRDYSFYFSVSSDEVSNMLEKESFDIFITDINIAGFNGINFISQLKTAYPLMKTIVTSAYGDMNTLRAVMRSGAHDFVIKPIDFQDLVLTIKNTVNTVLELKRAAVTAKKLSAISDELTLSAKLQKSILPGNSLKRDDVDVWADSIPAAEVGGDFYDFFWLDDTKVGIVMADVSGKNVTAAMFSIIAKTLIKSFSKIYKSPAECFKEVNKTLCEENVTTMFVTAMYGIFDTETHELTYTNAGHLPIAVVHPSKEPSFLECDSGIALGIMEDVTFQDNKYILSPGEIIMMYTDGVTEAANNSGEEFDFSRLIDVLKQHSITTPKLLVNDLIVAVKSFVSGAPQSDDITTLCLKYKPRIVRNVT